MVKVKQSSGSHHCHYLKPDFKWPSKERLVKILPPEKQKIFRELAIKTLNSCEQEYYQNEKFTEKKRNPY